MGPKLKTLDLFSGIGGFALALLPFAKPIAYCDKDPTAVEVLQHRMKSGDLPAAPIFKDVNDLQNKHLSKRVDLITAGFPCPDVSRAGNRAGINGGKQTVLVHQVLRLIAECKPSYVFLENVANIAKDKDFPDILQKLSNLGYDWAYDFFSAASVGAAHLRDRWFLLAKRRFPMPVEVSSAKCDPQLRRILRPKANSAGCMKDTKGCARVPKRYHALYGNALVPAAACEAFTDLLNRLRTNPQGQRMNQRRRDFEWTKNSVHQQDNVLYAVPRRPIGVCCGDSGKPWVVNPIVDRRGSPFRNKLPIITRSFSTMCLPTLRANVYNDAGRQLTSRSRRMLGRVVSRTKLCSKKLQGKGTTQIRMPFIENFMGFPSGWTQL